MSFPGGAGGSEAWFSLGLAALYWCSQRLASTDHRSTASGESSSVNIPTNITIRTAPHSTNHCHLIDVIAPAGSINSNVVDMAKWIRFQLARGSFEGTRLLDEARHAETWSPQIAVGPVGDYGLRWFLRDHGGVAVVEHGGNIDGFAAAVALLSDADIGFVLLTNTSSSPLQQDCIRIVADTLLGDLAQELFQVDSRRGKIAPNVGKGLSQAVVKARPEEIEELVVGFDLVATLDQGRTQRILEDAALIQ